jgi:dolichyl-phosphate-mannose-protein mannosyltransferase
VFDETYYVKDGYSLLVSGYERSWPDKANDAFVAGNPNVLLNTPEYVVHPPVGKWMIAAGMWLFGADNPFGWRFAAALTGTLSVALLALIAQKLFGSLVLAAQLGCCSPSTATTWSCPYVAAGHLPDVLGPGGVRRAVAGPRRRPAPAGHKARQAGGRFPQRQAIHAPAAVRPVAGRPLVADCGRHLPGPGSRHQVVGAVLCGRFRAPDGVLGPERPPHRRIRGWISAGIIRDGLLAFLSIVPVAAVTYAASWTGWFRSTDAYYRRWAETNSSAEWGWLPDSVRSLAHYHLEAYKFHQGLSSEHPYEASAWSWLVMGRPTSFFYESPKQGTPGCDFAGCTSAILSVGNPLIWWSAAIALVILLFWWAGRRDWRAGAVLAAVASGYLPWFMYPERTMFFFYAVSFEPFLVLALVYCLGLVLGKTTDPPWRRRSGLYGVPCSLWPRSWSPPSSTPSGLPT